MTKDLPYRIMGVDPGTNVLGYGIVEVENKTLRLIDLGVLYLKEETTQPEKLRQIFERLQDTWPEADKLCEPIC